MQPDELERLPNSPALVEPDEPKAWYRQTFGYMVAGAIGFVMILTAVSLYLYQTGGTAALDLSRPGYERARDEATEQPLDAFAADGPLTEQSLDQFSKLYEEELKKSKTEQFSSNALSNKALGLSGISD